MTPADAYQLIQKPQADTATAEKEQFRGILQLAISAGEITADAFSDIRRLTSQIQKSKSIPAAQKSVALSYLAANTTPASTGSQLNIRLQTQEANKDKTPVYAFDPRSQQTVMTTAGDADAQGLQGVRKVTEKHVREDTMLNNRLADVQQKISRYQAEATKPLSALDAAVLSGMLSEDKFKLGAFGAEIPVDFINKFMGAARDRNLSPDATRRVLAYFYAREALTGYNRVLTVSGRSSDKTLELQLQTLPDPLKSPQYAQEALTQFRENLRIVGQGLPRIPGVKTPSDIEQQFQRPNVSPTPAPPGTQPTHIYDPRTKTVFAIPGVMR